jgi:hypothetical protein
VHDRVSDEDPAEVMGDKAQRAAAGVGHAGAGQRAADELADRWAADRAVLAGVAALEQQRHRRIPDALVVVVGGGQGHGAVAAADAGDDGAEHIGQLRADDQQALGIGLGRRDLQQRDQLAAAGQLVLDEAVVGQLGKFLDPDAGVTQDVHGGPGPERLVFFEGEIAVPAGAGVMRPDPVSRRVRSGGPAQGLPAGGEVLAGSGVAGSAQPFGSCLLPGVNRGEKGGQSRDPFAGALVHP